MKAIFKNPIIRTVSVILLVLVLYFLSQKLGNIFNTQTINTDHYIYKGVINKTVWVVLCIIAMYLIPGYSFKDFGFRKPSNTYYVRIVWQTLLVFIVSVLFSMFLFMGLLNNIFNHGQETMGSDVDNLPFLTNILIFWIFASIAEEIPIRGLFQSLLDNLSKYKFFKISLPVWLSGLFFGFLHLSHYEPGRLFFAMMIVCMTSSIGVLAAYYREKSNSIYLAFLIHMLSNIYGMLMSLIG